MKLLLLLSALAFADEPKPLPQITVEQQRDYQRARANQANAQAQLAAAQKAFEESIAAMQKVCGERQLIANALGDPECGKEAPKK